MSLTDLASLGSFVSGVAVLVSLIFLYFQLRQVRQQVEQNNRHTQALIWQEATARGVNALLAMADADLCAAYIAGNGGTPTPEAIKERQFFLQVSASSLSMEDIFRQWNEELMTDVRFDRVRKHYPRRLAAEPGTRRVISGTVLSNVSTDDPYYAYLTQVLAEAEAQAAAD